MRKTHLVQLWEQAQEKHEQLKFEVVELQRTLRIRTSKMNAYRRLLEASTLSSLEIEKDLRDIDAN